jgi:preprotein translocase subunit YajC
MTMRRMRNLSLLMLTLSTAVLSAEGEAPMPARDAGIWQTFVMIGIAMAFFYFILWRPEQKRRKALEEERSHLQKGDKVVAMGILGEIAKVQEQTVVLKMIDGSQIEVLKGAITEVTSRAS